MAILRNNIVAIAFSLSIHALLLFLLVVSFDWTPKPQLNINKQNIVKAVAVDASKVKAELDKLKQAEERKKKKEQRRVEKLKREEQKLKKQRAAEEQRLANLKKKRLAEEKKRKAEQANLARIRKQQQELKRQQAAAEKKRKAAERKRKAEQARLAKLKKQQDAIKKQQALEKKKREEKARQRQKELAAQLAAEEKARANEIAKREIDKYQVLIRQKIERNWLKPPGELKALVTIVEVRLIPGGDVVDVSVVRTSGNLVYDRSAERAVRKASPLPLPKDPLIAAQLYNFKFEFKAE